MKHILIIALIIISHTLKAGEAIHFSAGEVSWSEELQQLHLQGHVIVDEPGRLHLEADEAFLKILPETLPKGLESVQEVRVPGALSLQYTSLTGEEYSAETPGSSWFNLVEGTLELKSDSQNQVTFHAPWGTIQSDQMNGSGLFNEKDSEEFIFKGSVFATHITPATNQVIYQMRAGTVSYAPKIQLMHVSAEIDALVHFSDLRRAMELVGRAFDLQLPHEGVSYSLRGVGDVRCTIQHLSDKK